ncbi:MAG: DUF4124 domain-containing protein [Rhodanobacteraceae bacterium]|nr:DUF4124 domain-containing protein [Rhodanobacteraceae bacterium]
MRIALLLLLLLHAAVAIAGKVYTWTDERGVVHYTDRPLGPEAAREVPGVESDRKTDLKPKRADDEALGKADLPDTAGLQGIWCQFERASDLPDTEVTPERVEWTFLGDTVETRNLDTGITRRANYTITDGALVADDVAIGRYPIREYQRTAMEIGVPSVHFRLRRGRC